MKHLLKPWLVFNILTVQKNMSPLFFVFSSVFCFQFGHLKIFMLKTIKTYYSYFSVHIPLKVVISILKKCVTHYVQMGPTHRLREMSHSLWRRNAKRKTLTTSLFKHHFQTLNEGKLNCSDLVGIYLLLIYSPVYSVPTADRCVPYTRRPLVRRTQTRF